MSKILSLSNDVILNENNVQNGAVVVETISTTYGAIYAKRSGHTVEITTGAWEKLTIPSLTAWSQLVIGTTSFKPVKSDIMLSVKNNYQNVDIVLIIQANGKIGLMSTEDKTNCNIYFTNTYICQ